MTMQAYPITRPWILLPLCLLVVILQVPLALLDHNAEPSAAWLPPLVVTAVFFVPLLFFGIRAHGSNNDVWHSRFALLVALYMCAGTVTGILVGGFSSWAPCALIVFYLLYSFRHSLNPNVLREQFTANNARRQSKSP